MIVLSAGAVNHERESLHPVVHVVHLVWQPVAMSAAVHPPRHARQDPPVVPVRGQHTSCYQRYHLPYPLGFFFFHRHVMHNCNCHLCFCHRCSLNNNDGDDNHHHCYHRCHQRHNHYISQSVYHCINQSVNEYINHSVNQCKQAINRVSNQPINHSANKPINQSANPFCCFNDWIQLHSAQLTQRASRGSGNEGGCLPRLCCAFSLFLSTSKREPLELWEPSTGQRDSTSLSLRHPLIPRARMDWLINWLL